MRLTPILYFLKGKSSWDASFEKLFFFMTYFTHVSILEFKYKVESTWRRVNFKRNLKDTMQFVLPQGVFSLCSVFFGWNINSMFIHKNNSNFAIVITKSWPRLIICNLYSEYSCPIKKKKLTTSYIESSDFHLWNVNFDTSMKTKQNYNCRVSLFCLFSYIRLFEKSCYKIK